MVSALVFSISVENLKMTEAQSDKGFFTPKRVSVKYITFLM